MDDFTRNYESNKFRNNINGTVNAVQFILTNKIIIAISSSYYQY